MSSSTSAPLMEPSRNERLIREITNAMPPRQREPINGLLDTIAGLRHIVNEQHQALSNISANLVGTVRRAITESDDKFAEAVDVLLDCIPSHEWESIAERVRDDLNLAAPLAEDGEGTADVRPHFGMPGSLDAILGSLMPHAAAAGTFEPGTEDPVATRLKRFAAEVLGVDLDQVQVLGYAPGLTSEMVDEFEVHPLARRTIRH